MLELSKIEKQYGTMPVLCGVSLSCQKGEAVCLAGANAAGKTTLLTIAAGLQKPDRGTLCCSGTVGIVSQELSLLSGLSVLDHLRLWYAASGEANKPFASGSAEEMLHLQPFADKMVSRLSGGIKKRTAIACALAGNPDFLLLDEPFTALDQLGRQELVALFSYLKHKKTGLLFSSHDPAAIAAVADRLVVLREGKIEWETMLEGEDRIEQVFRALSKTALL